MSDKRPRRQCAKCPWKVGTDPYEIPNNYDVEKHRALEGTIAEPGDCSTLGSGTMRMMACHESTNDQPIVCVGWLHHQLGPGNNIALRMRAAFGDLDTNYEIVGEQHERFEDTLP